MDRLLKLMSERGINQYKLAKAIKAPANTVNNWFKGRAKCPGDHYLNILAEYFDVTAAYLKFGDKASSTIVREVAGFGKLADDEMQWLRICRRAKELSPERLELALKLMEDVLKAQGLMLKKEKLWVRKKA